MGAKSHVLKQKPSNSLPNGNDEKQAQKHEKVHAKKHSHHISGHKKHSDDERHAQTHDKLHAKKHSHGYSGHKKHGSKQKDESFKEAKKALMHRTHLNLAATPGITNQSKNETTNGTSQNSDGGLIYLFNRMIAMIQWMKDLEAVYVIITAVAFAF